MRERERNSHQRKEAKYYELVQAGRARGYHSQLTTVEVELRGMLEDGDFLKLRSTLNGTAKKTGTLSGSHSIDASGVF